jgi:FkbM family methyltransferase
MTTAIETAGLTFLCDDPIEVWRAQTLLEKEPGTIAWLDRLQPGDAFYDVGANIGVYSLYAAKRGAKVFAFEPHALNALHLARNAKANGLDITVVQATVSHGNDFVEYRYRSLRAGTAGCALYPSKFDEEAAVWIHEAQLDDFLVRYERDTRPARTTFIKIDTDGDEKVVLLGMEHALTKRLPASIQVEVTPAAHSWIHANMALWKYKPVRVHYTQQGQQAIDGGADPATVVNNTIFERA